MYGGGWQYPVYASHYPPPGPVFLGPTAWAPAGAPANPHSPTGSPRQSPAGSPRVSPHTPVVPLAPEAYVNAPYPGQTYYHYPWSPNGSPWFTPTGFVPLPASPSLLAAYVPLPPSPSLSPVGAIPRPTYIPVPPIDPYYLPNTGPVYHNPAYAPRHRVHALLDPDLRYLILNLSVPDFCPFTPSQPLSNDSNARKLVQVHKGYLAQVATFPASTKLSFVLPAFGPHEEAWRVRVYASSPGACVSVGDILYSVHQSLQTPVKRAEWDSFPQADRDLATNAFWRRIRYEGSDATRGVLRVDFLGEKCYFGGIVKLKEDDVYRYKLLTRTKHGSA